jgi:hypothetical protein
VSISVSATAISFVHSRLARLLPRVYGGGAAIGPLGAGYDRRMADTERPGEAAKDEGGDRADAATTVGPNLPLQVQRNAEQAATGSSPSDEDDDDAS